MKKAQILEALRSALYNKIKRYPPPHSVASFCYRGNAESVYEVTLTKSEESCKGESMGEFKVKKLYLDMDGVLADFDRGVVEILGLEAHDQGKATPEENRIMYETMRNADHFYGRLELMPGAEKLFNCMRERFGDRCEILSGIPKPHRGILTAGEDKVEWMRRLLSKDIVMNIVYRAEKIKYCTGKDCILIDDYAKNIAEWEQAGGTGILYRNADDVLKTLDEMGAV